MARRVYSIDEWPDNTPFVPEHITFRWIPGDKWDRSQDDRKLQMWADNRWVTVSFVDLGFAIEFLTKNEQRLYPEPWHNGWKMLRKFVEMAYVNGWQASRNWLHEQRAQRALRVGQ